jgi:hypothetical protein
VVGLSPGSAEGPSPEGGRLTVTFAGSAFQDEGSGSVPTMRIHDLAQGRAVSGTATVRNPGPVTRFFWLSDGPIRQRPGDAGGSLGDALQLTILDVTRPDEPASVYRGPAGEVGPRPLGFLAPGQSRTYGFTADLPLGGLPPGAPAGFDPYRGATASLTFDWNAIEGSPGPERVPGPSLQRPRRRRDTRPPRLTLRVPRSQPLLEAGSLAVSAHCSEPCRESSSGTVRASGRALATSSRRSARLTRRHALRLRISTRALANIRVALTHGRSASIRVAVRASDRAHNRARATRTIRLRPAR